MPEATAQPDDPGAVLPAGAGMVRRSRPIYRVFVSSTWLDLQPERRALMDALNRMEEMRFVGMEFFGNRPDDTHDASIDQVDKCEVFIGIIGHRYGSGITEAEYRRARALNLPCFVYFKKGLPTGPDQKDNDPTLAAKLAAFKQDLMRGHTVKEVASPDELAASATADLHNWVAARWITLEREAVAVRPAAPVADADRTNILRLIERIEQDWVKGVLEASLHHRAWLELGLDWRDDAVEHPWDRIVVAPNRPIQTLGKQDSITGVFDSAQHTLLILGEPGAGKTTTALELARDLIARARESTVEPAPVVLALSTWRGQHKNLIDWLVSELGLRYQVPKRVARTWLEEGKLVLILDGLDEVVAGRRASCVDAINAFEQEHHPRGLAVTCRVAEYEALTAKLRLRSAICLQPLTPTQIDRYFQAAGASLDPLRRALQDDEGMRELARSPLMLSVMTMAWRDAPAETRVPFATVHTPEERRRQLFDAYVQAAMNRRGKASAGYTPEQTVGWLGWLARRMKEHGQTLFALEQLQPGWLEGGRQQFGYFLLTRVLMAIGLALPIWLLVPDKSAHVAVLAPMTFSGVLLALTDYGIFRWSTPENFKPWNRILILLIVIGFGPMLFLPVWESLLNVVLPGGAANPKGWKGELTGPMALFGTMLCATLTTLVDVRSRDIRPVDVIGLSWRQGARRAYYTALLLFQWFMIFGVVETGFLRDWTYARREFGIGEPGFWPGVVAGLLVAAVANVRLKQREWFLVVASLGGMAMFGGVVGQSLAGSPSRGLLVTTIVIGSLALTFGGLTSGIDETRNRRTGAWFWLRIPLLAAMAVMAIMSAVIGTFGLMIGGRVSIRDLLAITVGIAGICGVVAFFRFGGYQGMQHFVLRWLLKRSGRLPPKPVEFLDQAVRLNLMQRVGFGYRFIHALLLEHIAALRTEAKHKVDRNP